MAPTAARAESVLLTFLISETASFSRFVEHGALEKV